MKNLIPYGESATSSTLTPEAIPERETLLAFLAGGYLRFGQWKKARSMFALLLSLSPGNEEYRMALGLACFKDGRPEESLGHLDDTIGKRIGQDVRSVPFWQALLLCNVLRENGMASEALAIFEYRMQAPDAPDVEALPR